MAIAKKLKEVHSIKTNLTFVSNLAQASICASVAGAAAVAMPVDKVRVIPGLFSLEKICEKVNEFIPTLILKISDTFLS